MIVNKTSNPIRAIRQGVIYVLGSDSTDGNKTKLFLMSTQTGEMLNSVDISTLCSNCGVAVAPNGTIYVNDLTSNRIYRLNH